MKYRTRGGLFDLPNLSVQINEILAVDQFSGTVGHKVAQTRMNRPEVELWRHESRTFVPMHQDLWRERMQDCFQAHKFERPEKNPVLLIPK